MGGLEPVCDWLDAQLFMTNFRPVRLQEHVCFGSAAFSVGSPRHRITSKRVAACQKGSSSSQLVPSLLNPKSYQPDYPSITKNGFSVQQGCGSESLATSYLQGSVASTAPSTLGSSVEDEKLSKRLGLQAERLHGKRLQHSSQAQRVCPARQSERLQQGLPRECIHSGLQPAHVHHVLKPTSSLSSSQSRVSQDESRHACPQDERAHCIVQPDLWYADVKAFKPCARCQFYGANRRHLYCEQGGPEELGYTRLAKRVKVESGRHPLKPPSTLAISPHHQDNAAFLTKHQHHLPGRSNSSEEVTATFSSGHVPLQTLECVASGPLHMPPVSLEKCGNLQCRQEPFSASAARGTDQSSQDIPSWDLLHSARRQEHRWAEANGDRKSSGLPFSSAFGSDNRASGSRGHGGEGGGNAGVTTGGLWTDVRAVTTRTHGPHAGVPATGGCGSGADAAAYSVDPLQKQSVPSWHGRVYTAPSTPSGCKNVSSLASPGPWADSRSQPTKAQCVPPDSVSSGIGYAHMAQDDSADVHNGSIDTASLPEPFWSGSLCARGLCLHRDVAQPSSPCPGATVLSDRVSAGASIQSRLWEQSLSISNKTATALALEVVNVCRFLCTSRKSTRWPLTGCKSPASRTYLALFTATLSSSILQLNLCVCTHLAACFGTHRTVSSIASPYANSTPFGRLKTPPAAGIFARYTAGIMLL
jgi:hypothetical protein